ncbi:hypothetical protein QR680_014384 [Steinernema hermaphroditum]|uniref:Uncharacterized protein n=1 Tax=Steinernema hermaphroditum TaxID=289476 RepID=A0AA39IAV4_9BILA|nr:hypothetical protein QR680_014384 [Steinernema hermaphroditum]
MATNSTHMKLMRTKSYQTFHHQVSLLSHQISILVSNSAPGMKLSDIVILIVFLPIFNQQATSDEIRIQQILWGHLQDLQKERDLPERCLVQHLETR